MQQSQMGRRIRRLVALGLLAILLLALYQGAIIKQTAISIIKEFPIAKWHKGRVLAFLISSDMTEEEIISMLGQPSAMAGDLKTGTVYVYPDVDLYIKTVRPWRKSRSNHLPTTNLTTSAHSIAGKW